MPKSQLEVPCKTLNSSVEMFTIKTAMDFYEVFRDLMPEQRDVVLDTIKDQLSHLVIKKAIDLWFFHWCLSKEQFAIVFDVIKDKLPELVKTREDFHSIFRTLTEAQFAVVFDVLKDKLPALVETAEDFNYIFEYLTEAQSNVVFDAIKDKLPDLIQAAYDFNYVFRNLTEAQSNIVSDIFLVKQVLHKIFPSLEEFCVFIEDNEWMLEELVYLKVVRSYLLTKIKNFERDLLLVCASISGEENRAVLQKNFFMGLVDEVKSFFNSETSETLIMAAEDYFSGDRQTRITNFKHFKDTCESAFETLQLSTPEKKSVISQIQQKLELFFKCLATILTFGGTIIVSSVKSYYETGQFKNRFFETPGERAVDNVMRAVDAVKPKQTSFCRV